MLLPIHNDYVIWPNASARDQFSVETIPLHVHNCMGRFVIITTIIVIAWIHFTAIGCCVKLYACSSPTRGVRTAGCDPMGICYIAKLFEHNVHWFLNSLTIGFCMQLNSFGAELHFFACFEQRRSYFSGHWTVWSLEPTYPLVFWLKIHFGESRKRNIHSLRAFVQKWL